MNTIKKFWAAVVYIVGLSLALQPALALPAKHTENLNLPQAEEGAEVIYLGKKTDPKTKLEVDGIMFIHKKNNAKNGSARKPGGTTCYSYLGAGAKWKGTPESWLMNTANTRGLDGNAVFNLMSNGIAKWEDAADGNVGNSLGVNILGDGSTTSSVLTADSAAPDGVNEVYFADISGGSTIGVTTVWGIFGGPTFNRQLVEWDMVLDDVTFDWSTSGDLAKMDFDSIATHELGHAVGMGHPSNSCTEETMFAYGTEGETKKRDLNTGDIQGINNLY